jgi:hypothetical protein
VDHVPADIIFAQHPPHRQVLHQAIIGIHRTLHGVEQALAMLSTSLRRSHSGLIATMFTQTS